jgi:hypothetical protein
VRDMGVRTVYFIGRHPSSPQSSSAAAAAAAASGGGPLKEGPDRLNKQAIILNPKG